MHIFMQKKLYNHQITCAQIW